ncbi:MAG: single-stranded DNA-binding protein [Spirochaetes bacterium]|nr:single-stranded DNA-binding protein [Spirochaetota bacterium]MBU0954853.1 single-stranded DNA-binding protein [Spirochaetota bacterium]
MLSNLNSIIVEGNLVRDPLLKSTPNNHDVCSFSVASNRFYRVNDQNEKEVSYFDVETWSKLAQTCGNNLRKGRGVRIVGRLKQERWLDQAGKTQAKIKIVAEHVEFKPQPKKEAGALESGSPENDQTIDAAEDSAEISEETMLQSEAVF